jgi:hypothetical protein
MAPKYERTELVRTRTSLAFAKNRVQRYLAKAAEAETEVAEIEAKIAALEAQAGE